VRLSLKAGDLPDNLKPLRDEIERRVPLGVGGGHDHVREIETDLLNDNYSYTELEKVIVNPLYKGNYGKFVEKAASQLGSLGSGNHFIEICIDENEDVWVMLHSGSRGIGNMIGTHYIAKAKLEWRSSLSPCQTTTLPTSQKAQKTSTTIWPQWAGRRTTRLRTAAS